MIAWSVDDFPAPFGPIRPTISPRPHLERKAAHGLDRSVPDLRFSTRAARSLDSSSAAALSPR